MPDAAIQFVVPGSLDQRTGGYLYDRRIALGLRAGGRPVDVHELAGAFPSPDTTARAAAVECARALRQTDGVAVIDGLALAAFAACRDDLPAVWIALVHHPLMLETGLDPAAATSLGDLETGCLRHASRIVVTSPATARDLERVGLERERIRVVLPGTDPAPVAPGSGEGRGLLSVGSVIPRKGYDVLIEALAGLPEVPWRLLVAGSRERDPYHAARVQMLARDGDVADRITWAGELDRPALEAAYQVADVFVLPSHHEGYGMALAEALARGLPVVSTRAGAIPDTVPAAAGLLVPPGDAEALRVALRQVLTDSDLRARLRASALAARTKLPDWPTAVAAFATVLAELDD